MSFKSFKASSGAMGGSAVVRTGRSAGGWEHSVKASAIWLKKAMIPGTFQEKRTERTSETKDLVKVAYENTISTIWTLHDSSSVQVCEGSS